LNKDYYAILGVDKGVGQDELKKAYRSLSKEHHPDHGGDEEKFKEISEAYSVLSDPEKRKDYDNPMRQMGGFPFGDMFGFGGRQPGPPDLNAPRRGQNIMLEHPLPIHYFIFGGKFKVNFSFRDACPACNGTGAEEKETCANCKGMGQIMHMQRAQGMTMRSSIACPACMGRGFTIKRQCESCKGATYKDIDKDVTLEVPKNVREGHVVGAVGEGHIGLNGGPSGDFVVKLFMQLPQAESLNDDQRKVLEGLYV
jgi:molecular chaperone DnaJ